jgi:Flp pilus assembly protein TadG
MPGTDLGYQAVQIRNIRKMARDDLRAPGIVALRLCADRGGAAAVEFALLLPVLVLLAAGLIDSSRLIAERMQLQAAADAGADYARANGWNPAAIQNAVLAATALSGVSAPTPQMASDCVSGTTLVPTSTGACPSGAAPGGFVTVTAQTPFSTLTPWPQGTFPATLAAQAVVRIQ